jgi:hypothetical protein
VEQPRRMVSRRRHSCSSRALSRIERGGEIRTCDGRNRSTVLACSPHVWRGCRYGRWRRDRSEAASSSAR